MNMCVVLLGDILNGYRVCKDKAPLNFNVRYELILYYI